MQQDRFTLILLKSRGKRIIPKQSVRIHTWAPLVSLVTTYSMLNEMAMLSTRNRSQWTNQENM